MVDPIIWGSSAWLIIHTTVFNYPDSPNEETKSNYKQFYYSFQHTLPCDKCKYHYSEIIKSNPIDDYLISRDYLFYWTWYIHSLVNSNTNNHNLSYIKTIEEYNRLAGKNLIGTIHFKDTKETKETKETNRTYGYSRPGNYMNWRRYY